MFIPPAAADADAWRAWARRRLAWWADRTRTIYLHSRWDQPRHGEFRAHNRRRFEIALHRGLPVQAEGRRLANQYNRGRITITGVSAERPDADISRVRRRADEAARCPQPRCRANRIAGGLPEREIAGISGYQKKTRRSPRLYEPARSEGRRHRTCCAVASVLRPTRESAR